MEPAKIQRVQHQSCPPVLFCLHSDGKTDKKLWIKNWRGDLGLRRTKLSESTTSYQCKCSIWINNGEVGFFKESCWDEKAV